jgi:hypothetical protein
MPFVVRQNSPMPRPQFTLRTLLVAMLVVAAFFGGMRLERELRTRAEQAVRVPAVVHPPDRPPAPGELS